MDSLAASDRVPYGYWNIRFPERELQCLGMCRGPVLSMNTLALRQLIEACSGTVGGLSNHGNFKRVSFWQVGCFPQKPHAGNHQSCLPTGTLNPKAQMLDRPGGRRSRNLESAFVKPGARLRQGSILGYTTLWEINRNL